VVAGGVCGLVDASAVAIKLAIFPGDELSVVFGVEVDGALGGSGGDELGGLVEVDGVLVGEDGRGLREDEAQQVASKENFNKVRHILINQLCEYSNKMDNNFHPTPSFQSKNCCTPSD
jgi:hypothetical protein